MKGKNEPRVINAWAIFDWANSAYALVISTAIFPVYFIKNTPTIIDIWGFQFTNSSLYTYAVSFAYIIIAALSPLLAGIADFSGKRMFFLKLFTLIGSISCMLLYFFKGEPSFWLGTSAFILATIGFAGSLVFYDSFLPIIATEDKYDRVSARGYSFGYIGSVLLLIAILFMVLKPDLFGITDPHMPARIGFVMVGFWWFGFAQYTFRHLPKDSLSKIKFDTLKKGYSEVIKVFHEARQMINVKRFLLAFFLYSAGVQTVVYVSTIFADKELHMETSELIIVVLLIQLVGIVGAVFFSRLSEKIGNKLALMIQISAWLIICLCAYKLETKTAFYILACMVGLVMGGIQALSRATYSKLLREGEKDVTSFFSLYDVIYKLSIVGGTFLFAIVDQLTHNMRNSVLVLAMLFMLGLIAIRNLDVGGRKIASN